MIESVHIKNFKSIYDLEIEVGRVNLIIGENGSGKSNLLEALVLVAASELNKLDNEFLASRGIRVTEPTLMRSAFNADGQNGSINISILFNSKRFEYEFNNDNAEYSNWRGIRQDALDELFEHLIRNSVQKKLQTYKTADVINRLIRKPIAKNNKKVNLKININDAQILKENMREAMSKMFGLTLFVKYPIKDFVIYSPENTALRNFYKEGQIEPLGINGEGLLKLLKTINHYEDKSYMEEIVSSLRLFSWFEDIEIPSSLPFGEDKVVIKDRFLYREIDQRSANEGFLFILFYITLLVAKETPKVFAIDNIDASLNPKLCTKLMSLIASLAAKYDKQVFLTTHNPAVLDGIDLNDKEQKLFVMSRNKEGHTRVKNISVEDKPKSSNDEPLKLSEAFLRGYLGGLPKGF